MMANTIKGAIMKSRGTEFDDLVVAMYSENHSAYKTGQRLDVSHKYVYRVLKNRGVSIPGWSDEKPHRRAIPLELEPQVLEDHASGMTFKEMCEKYKCSDWAVRYLVKRSGSARRKHGGQGRKFSHEEVAEMNRLAAEGWSQVAIGAKFESSQITVSRILRSSGAVVRGKHAHGETHGSWRGGVTKTQGGYVLQAVPPDHPMASMRISTGYVLQHRLVMAEKIGRPLSRAETVHHINGDISDNRPENLQLRQGRHGKGVVLRCACCGSTDIVATKIAEAD